MSDVFAAALKLHRRFQGKLAVTETVALNNRRDLSLLYTPGVAEPCRVIARHPDQAYDLTWKGRTVAVISDGSAVLGLGNIGPAAALPVMEGKALLLKRFADVDAVPLVINTQEPDEIVRFVRQIAPSFAGINLEDISAPRCFQIEEELQTLGIPVFHDDQHGTAIVVAAALHNAAKVVNKSYQTLRVVIVGAGAAGLAVARMLLGLNCSANVCQYIPGLPRVKDVVVVDREGALVLGRVKMNLYKQAVAAVSNHDKKAGTLDNVIKNADVVIGVSAPGLVKPTMIKAMAPAAIVFSLANPIPEIMPDAARAAGAAVVASGRSDFPNQINNVLAFPGIFRAVIKGRLTQINQAMKVAAVRALANMIKTPGPENIIPDVFTPKLAEKIAQAVLTQA
ncbi:NADP-dependent malic enzyme [Patescibacteria group bacterium]|nr:NADP-dependent malic enzyme [Patescibacteria group bacterium]MCL5091343.1 NADP-dependent malic enzyme [Patescibacteria group bacterium]